jgi:hypothetical protein
MMMAAFSRMSLDEARRFVLPPRRATQEQYQESVRGLTAESAGQLELGSDDRSITERARLKAAAQAVGKTLEIRRQGNMMVFWGTDEPPKTRTKSAAAQIGRGKRR